MTLLLDGLVKLGVDITDFVVGNQACNQEAQKLKSTRDRWNITQTA